MQVKSRYTFVVQRFGKNKLTRSRVLCTICQNIVYIIARKTCVCNIDMQEL